MYKEFFEEGTYYGAVFGWWHGPIFYYTIYGPNSVEEVVGDLCEIVCYIIFRLRRVTKLKRRSEKENLENISFDNNYYYFGSALMSANHAT